MGWQHYRIKVRKTAPRSMEPKSLHLTLSRTTNCYAWDKKITEMKSWSLCSEARGNPASFHKLVVMINLKLLLYTVPPTTRLHQVSKEDSVQKYGTKPAWQKLWQDGKLLYLVWQIGEIKEDSIQKEGKGKNWPNLTCLGCQDLKPKSWTKFLLGI